MYYASQGMGGLAALEESVAPSFLGKLRKPKEPRVPKAKKPKKSRFAESTGCQPGLIQNPDGTCRCPDGQVMTPDATCVQAGGFSTGVSKSWLQQVMSTPSPGAGGGGSGVIVSTTPGINIPSLPQVFDGGATHTFITSRPTLPGAGGGGGYDGGYVVPPTRPGISSSGGGGGGAKCPPGSHFTGGGCCPDGTNWDAARNGCVKPGGGGGGGGGGGCAPGKVKIPPNGICCDAALGPIDPRAAAKNQCCPVGSWNPSFGGRCMPPGVGGAVQQQQQQQPQDFGPTSFAPLDFSSPSDSQSSGPDLSASSTMFTSVPLEGLSDFSSSLPWIAAGLLIYFLSRR
jgi:hypothetical protein